jgi:hypothetical protein
MAMTRKAIVLLEIGDVIRVDTHVLSGGDIGMLLDELRKAKVGQWAAVRCGQNDP